MSNLIETVFLNPFPDTNSRAQFLRNFSESEIFREIVSHLRWDLYGCALVSAPCGTRALFTHLCTLP